MPSGGGYSSAEVFMKNAETTVCVANPEDISVKDIAERCSISLSAVYQRLNRMTDKLGRVPTMPELLQSALSAKPGRPRKY